MARRLPAAYFAAAKYRHRVQLVVGAAIIRDGRVLAARRTSPPSSAGKWEFPGGKVEVGESMSDALTREIREELDCEIDVVTWLPGSVRLTDAHTLMVAHAALVVGEPEASTDHDELRWITADELHDVAWLEADVAFLAAVREGLLEPTVRGTARGIVFEESVARSVAVTLQRGGYRAEVHRERLAGEDDDEGHDWAIVTDAPTHHLEVLIDPYDGWLDVPELIEPGLPPPTLPPGPKR